MIIELSLVLICHFQKRSELTPPPRAGAEAPQFQHRGWLREAGVLLPARTTLPFVVTSAAAVTAHQRLGATSPHTTAPQVGSIVTPTSQEQKPSPWLPSSPTTFIETTGTSFPSTGVPTSSRGQAESSHIKPHLPLPSSDLAMALHERRWVPPGPPLQPPTALCPHSELQPSVLLVFQKPCGLTAHPACPPPFPFGCPFPGRHGQFYNWGHGPWGQILLFGGRGS